MEDKVEDIDVRKAVEELDNEPQSESQEPQNDPIIERARELGWRPKEEFSGSDEDFIDADEFVRRQPLFEKIELETRRSKKLQRELEQFKQHYLKVEEAAYKRALNDLKAQRKQALREGDVDLVEQLEDRIEQEKQNFEETQRAAAVEQQPTVHPEFEAWVDRNRWYNTEAHMRVFADQEGTRLSQQGLAPSEVLKQVEQLVRKEFPNKFSNQRRSEPSAVAAPRAGGKAPKADPIEAELSDMERKIMNDLVRGGHITKEQYLADYKKVKGV